MYYQIITQDPLDVTVVTLDEAKAQCRVTHTFDDAYITSLIPVALELAQTFTRKLLTPGTVKVVVDDGRPEILVPFGGVASVTELKLDDVVSTDFTFDPVMEKLTPTVTYTKAEVTFDTGYTELPATVKHAVLMMISTFYNQRDDMITGVNIEKIPHRSTVLLGKVKNYVV